LIYRSEISEILRLAGWMAKVDSNNDSPFRYAVKLLKRMVQLFREYVSYQDVCQLVKIAESICDDMSQGSFDTIAIRCSIVLAQGANNIDLEIQKHSWTACFDAFQNEARSQLAKLGHHTAFFSFSLFPASHVGGQANDLASDLYLCMRIGHRNDASADRIYSRANIDTNGIRGRVTDVGFAL
jgi:hypothetical protein